ncbi:ArsR/SmtB family transcription factor [Streptomyces sp. NPDC047928]|uniref:ArsR/SmtB family transcription factor n=1 Tax=unclassified Streptomyces TaxID=2593676 RepID=UPI003723EE84
MLRIVFTAEDLTKITFRRFSLWPETVLSLGRLQGSQPTLPALHRWRRKVLASLGEHRLMDEIRQLGGLLSLNDPLDTPRTGGGGGRGGNGDGSGSGGGDGSGSGGIGRRGRAARLLRQYQRIAIHPYRDHIDAAIADDLRRRGQLILHGGYAASLTELGGRAYWSGTVLTAPHPTPVTLRLTGQGLVLQPSYFCPQDHTMLLGRPDRPVLLYPVEERRGRPAGKPCPAAAPLFGSLLGRTRAQVLPLLLDGGCSTTHLAERLDVSPATASQHASALRDLGLVSTERKGRAVEHRLTPFALRLLDTCG